MSKDTGHSFAAYYKRAVSPIIVLSLLRERDMYGYEISQSMLEKSNNKLGVSVLYPVLYRLVEQGYVVVTGSRIENGRAREYYGITDKGRKYLESVISEYKELSALFLNIVAAEQKGEE